MSIFEAAELSDNFGLPLISEVIGANVMSQELVFFRHRGPPDSAITRNTLPGKNDLFNAYNTEPDDDGNITVTFGVGDPEDGTYWMPVNAGEPYYFVMRYYKPDLNNLPQKPCK